MDKKTKRRIRHFRVRKKVVGTDNIPRLSVFRSNKNIYAQLIDDRSAKTLFSVSSLKFSEAKGEGATKISRIDLAAQVGEALAKIAIQKNIKKTVFDRGGYKYHGRIKSLAEGARKGGLKF